MLLFPLDLSEWPSMLTLSSETSGRSFSWILEVPVYLKSSVSFYLKFFFLNDVVHTSVTFNGIFCPSESITWYYRARKDSI